MHDEFPQTPEQEIQGVLLEEEFVLADSATSEPTFRPPATFLAEIDAAQPAVERVQSYATATNTPPFNPEPVEVEGYYYQYTPMDERSMAEVISHLDTGDIVTAYLADSPQSTEPMVITGPVNVLGSNVFFPLSIYLRGTTGQLHSHLQAIELVAGPAASPEPQDLGTVVEANGGDLLTRFTTTDPAWIDANGERWSWNQLERPRITRRPVVS